MIQIIVNIKERKYKQKGFNVTMQEIDSICGKNQEERKKWKTIESTKNMIKLK